MEDVTPAVLRRTRLPGGGELIVREAEEADRAGLESLYAGLDDDARYRRFFSAYQPGSRFFDRLLSASERGAACLVARVVDRPAADAPDERAADGPAADGPDGARVVAEATYEPLPDGNAELAITVDRAWRGWLGPYLLDALLEHAGAHGYPNLEADVLVTNRPMLALLRARRLATAPRTEWTVLRAVVGAAQDVPSWPPNRMGRRILIEGGGARWPGADDAEAAGFEVLACPGPTECRTPCPLLRGGTCPLVEGADAIVMTSTATEGGWDDVRAAHREQHPEVPVIVRLGRHRLGGAELVHTVEERLAEADSCRRVQEAPGA